MKFYVDGSWSSKNPKVVGWGFCTPDMKIAENGALKGGPSKQQQVPGEMAAAMRAVLCAVKNGVKDIELLTDYEGLQFWVDGSWKAKTVYSQQYRDWMRKAVEKYNLNLTFTKIDPAENLADELARKVTGAKSKH